MAGHYVSDRFTASGGKYDYGPLPDWLMAINTHYTWVQDSIDTPAAAPQASPVTPTFDPKLEANALYGKPMALYTGGYARMGASPAPIVGPYMTADTASFIVSFGVPSNPEGSRRIYKIYLDNELAWTSSAGGTLPGDGTFTGEPFNFIFKTGTLTQSACSLESMKFPGDENAYRPQMLLQILDIPIARFMANTGKPVPYVACDIGDVTDGADPLDGINLGEALERIAFSPWAGYTAASFDAVGVTDVVDAILIKDNFTIVQLCQSITGEYRNLDLVLSDKVRVKDRGSSVTPDFIFGRDSIIAGDSALSIARANATAQRREHELVTIDPDQDYTAVPSLAKIPRDPVVISAAVGKETTTLPVVINADTRQAIATFAQNYAENARRKVTFQVPVSAYEIEPGDLFALASIADGIDNEVFKCTQTTHGANWVVDVEGEAILRCSVYGDDVSGCLTFATWDAATVASVVLSGGDLHATNTGTTSANQGARVLDAAGRTSGKYYFEVTRGAVGAGNNTGFGIGTITSTYTGMGNSATTGSRVDMFGRIWTNGSNTGITLSALGTGQKCGVAVDLDNRMIWFRRSPTDLWNNSATANPSTNTGGVAIPAGTMVPFCTFGGTFGATAQDLTANFGLTAFGGLVPSGFTAGWCGAGG